MIGLREYSLSRLINRTISCPEKLMKCASNLKLHITLSIYIILAIWRLPWPIHFPSAGLDPSWQLGMNLAYSEGMKFGKDVAFTYGVLGFLNTPMLLDYNLWKWSLLFCLFFSFFYILSFYLFLSALSAKWYYNIFIIISLLSIFPYETTSPPLLLIAIPICIYAIIRRNKSDWIASFGLLGLGSFLAIIAFIKFNFLFVSIYIILISFFSFILRNGQFKNGIYLLLSYIVSFVAIWLITEQDVRNIVPYLYNGIEISTGYNEAMAVSGPDWQIYLGIFYIFILFITFLYFIHSNNKDMILFFILNLFTMFTSYKLGFVRQDLHILNFLSIFTIFAALILIVLLQDREIKPTDKWLFSVIILNAAILFSLVISTYIISPQIFHEQVDNKVSSYELSANMLKNHTLFENQLTSAREKVMSDYPLDKQIISRIGGNAVDIFPWDVALCWAYGLNWTPRPVFQSYSAYTMHLDDINSQHFISLKAPQKILFALKSIDEKYSLFDEPATFHAILKNYKYEYGSGGFLLLSRADSKIDRDVDLGSVNSKFNTSIPVPKYDKGFVFGKIELHYSLWGKIISLLYKPSFVYIQFKFSDGRISRKFRFIPNNAQNGIFLSEYIQSADDLALLFKGKLIRYDTISGIFIETDHPNQYNDTIKVLFKGLTANTSIKTSNKLQFAKLWGSAVEPDNLYSDVRELCINNVCRSAIYQHPIYPNESIIRFNNITIPKDPVLRFGIALDPQVWSPEKGDGVQFEIQIAENGSVQTIFSKYIDPKNNGTDRKWNDFLINLSKFKKRVVCVNFKTCCGPNNNCAYDWAYWGDPILEGSDSNS